MQPFLCMTFTSIACIHQFLEMRWSIGQPTKHATTYYKRLLQQRVLDEPMRVRQDQVQLRGHDRHRHHLLPQLPAPGAGFKQKATDRSNNWLIYLTIMTFHKSYQSNVNRYFWKGADIFLPRFYLLWPSLGFPEKLPSSKSAVAWPTEITEINLITLHPYD